MNSKEIDDRYKDCFYVRRLGPIASKSDLGSVYTVVEADNSKGIRVTALSSMDSEKPKIIREMRLDNSLGAQHLEAII